MTDDARWLDEITSISPLRYRIVEKTSYAGFCFLWIDIIGFYAKPLNESDANAVHTVKRLSTK